LANFPSGRMNVTLFEIANLSFALIAVKCLGTR
jgi:hypothetical protein